LIVVVLPVGRADAAGDDCAAATLVSNLPYTDSSDTAAATLEATDPTPPCGNGSRAKSVWYGFTASESVVLAANTFGSGYDTILSVYTGACGLLGVVSGACNDDAGPGGTSQVMFTAAAG
jgi:hypothetical protein